MTFSTKRKTKSREDACGTRSTWMIDWVTREYWLGDNLFNPRVIGLAHAASCGRTHDAHLRKHHSHSRHFSSVAEQITHAILQPLPQNKSETFAEVERKSGAKNTQKWQKEHCSQHACCSVPFPKVQVPPAWSDNLNSCGTIYISIWTMSFCTLNSKFTYFERIFILDIVCSDPPVVEWTSVYFLWSLAKFWIRIWGMNMKETIDTTKRAFVGKGQEEGSCLQRTTQGFYWCEWNESLKGCHNERCAWKAWGSPVHQGMGLQCPHGALLPLIFSFIAH